MFAYAGAGAYSGLREPVGSEEEYHLNGHNPAQLALSLISQVLNIFRTCLTKRSLNLGFK